MSSHLPVDVARVRVLSDRPPKASALYVLLWVQQDQRAACNHALEFAIHKANQLGLPVLACFGLCEHFPDANERAFKFLLEGLRDAASEFAERGVRFVCLRGPPPDVVSMLGRSAACIVTDCGYARICKAWRQEVVNRLSDTLVIQVETNVVVPVRTASLALEPQAATLRPKIERSLPRFLLPVPKCDLKCRAVDMRLPEEFEGAVLCLEDPVAALEKLEIDRSVPAGCFVGGSREARTKLEAFLHRLPKYGNGKSNDPSVQETSQLSPYLHFGQISPLEIALTVKDASPVQQRRPFPSSFNGQGGGASAFLEELIVRRELARNFCFYNDAYDKFDCAPHWAQASLMRHATDPRLKTYNEKELARGQTDDPWWNAAQWEMVATGHMHNYMRMYWCKQFITWIANPREAFALAVAFNNKFSLDGRDENGYMGIAWCFGNHDRPFPDRQFFGEVRPMTRNGLESKFNVQRYKDLVQRKCRSAVAKEPRLMALLPQCAFGGTENMPSLLSFCMPSRSSCKKDMQDSKAIDSNAVADPVLGVSPVPEKGTKDLVSPKPCKEKAVEVGSGVKRKNGNAPLNNGLYRFFKSSAPVLESNGCAAAESKRPKCASDTAEIIVD